MMPPLELWVGPEATVNRVGDDYFDQLEATGFAERLDDLDRLASLGARRMRFPLLWERTERHHGCHDWSWADKRLARLRALGVQPIVGLLHHGSGPLHTNLLDDAFPRKLADYALAVARRYPWLNAYTPVNEPLTTARFSALYGLWYPHETSDESFVRALLNEVKATVLAMRAIRTVTPGATLVQTDDLGHTSGTRRLQYQVDFDNERRWLAFDLLAGRVDADHPLREYLLDYGASEAELNALLDSPCMPDVVGINVYITSERFLDHRLHRYPEHLHGGNNQEAYADTEAVRVLGAPIGGFEARLREAAERYGQPVAITEAHLGCSREEQMRWLLEAWQAAGKLREEGVDVRAVTAWAAFGTYDWDSLLTQKNGNYEPGLFDVRGATPRATGLATLARSLATSDTPAHVVTQHPGWWRRDVRHLYKPHGMVRSSPEHGRLMLITGATGTLGQAFARLCALRGLPFRLLSRAELDIGDPASVRAALTRWNPWALVNTAGYVRVDDAQRDERQWRENALGPAMLAEACSERGVALMSFSSDLVFDGRLGRAYRESDAPSPLNAYGHAKLAAEQQVLERMPSALMVRTSAFFGPWDRYNFITMGLACIARGEPWLAARDQVVSPAYVPDLVNASLDLLIDGEQGLWHLTNEGAVSWVDFGRMAAKSAGFSEGMVEPVAGESLSQTAPRPAYAALESERGRMMPSLDGALSRYFDDVSVLASLSPPARAFGLHVF